MGSNWLAEHLRLVTTKDVNLVRAYMAQADKIDHEFTEAPERRYKKTVFHYTDDAAMVEILKTGKLRLTDFTELNDPQEIEYGIRIARDVMAAEVEKGDDWVAAFGEMFQRVFKEGARDTTRAFVLSMSTAPDELSQWRAYGQNGAGYRFGFKPALLNKAFHHPNAKPGGFFLVQYDKQKLNRQLHRIIRRAITTVVAIGKIRRDEDMMLAKEVLARCVFSVLVTALHFKHPAYRAEQEYRYILLENLDSKVEGIQKRGRRSALVDYIELDWRSHHEEALVEIMSGPGVGERTGKDFIKACLKLTMPRSNIRVLASSIPYRA